MKEAKTGDADEQLRLSSTGDLGETVLNMIQSQPMGGASSWAPSIYFVLSVVDGRVLPGALNPWHF